MPTRSASWQLRDNPALSPVLVWVLFALDALAILVTYARLPAEDTYHVSGTGLPAGAGRVLVFMNFPLAFAAIALIGVAMLRLRSRALAGLASAGVTLCAIAALPGVVDQGDLDADWINTVPALGVLIALGLTVASLRISWPEKRRPWANRNSFGTALIAALFLVSLPWIVADLGFFIDDIPLIGRLFIASEIPDGSTIPAVHLGHHHGLDGWLFVTAALVLGRVLRFEQSARLAIALRGYLGAMFAYGLANLLNDLWLEQVVKRGWSDHPIPSFLRPQLSLAWGLLIIGASLAWYLLFRPAEPDHLPASTESRRQSPADVPA